MLMKDQLKAVFEQMTRGSVPYTVQSSVLRLPSLNEEPSDLTEDRNNTVLISYSIDTISIEKGDTLELLIGLSSVPTTGLQYGDTVRFWSSASKLTLEIIAGQRFYPCINENLEAIWKMAPSPSDQERMDHLARAMPRICVVNNDGAPPGSLLRDFMNGLADFYIRSILNVSIPTVKRGRGPTKIDPSMFWWEPHFAQDDIGKNNLSKIKKKLDSWSTPLSTAFSERPFRTCFKLGPPEGSEEVWSIRFYLQSNEDPSLLLPAVSVWNGRKKKNDLDPKGILLEDLGRASRIYPVLERCLDRSCPSEMSLTTEEAYDFLREIGPLLQQSGMGVMLPAWWNTASSKIGVKLKVRDQKGISSRGHFGMEGLLAFDWSLALGNEDISRSEFERLSKMKVPLVRFKGQWVEVRKEDVEKAIDFFERKANGLTIAELLRFGSGMDDGKIGLNINSIEAEGWASGILGGLKGGSMIERLKVPKAFKGTLRPYQERGYWWMVYLKQLGLGACLADDMGLGKTIQLIVLLLYGQKGRKLPSLVICPMSVVGNWHMELGRFAPTLKVLVHHGPERKKGRTFVKEVRGSDVVITTYSLATRDIEDLSRIEWENVVVDEAQNIKNQDTKQTRAIKSLQGNFKIAMTGTPVENRLTELWSIMDFINPGYLGGGREFIKQFANPIERYGDYERSRVLKALIQPFILRRLKTDKSIIKDLPEKNEMKVYCNLTKEQGTLYQAIVDDMLLRISESEGIKRRGIILSTLMKLKQVCNHPAHLLGDRSKLEGRSGKLNRFEEMIDEAMSEGDRSLIFTQFTTMGDLLQPYLREKYGKHILFLHGGTTKRERDLMIKRFQSTGGPPLFILSLKAGGTGLNLTSANRVFHFDRWWNPAVEDQATDRAYRIGQVKNVQVHKFVCIGTVEERIDRMIEEKKELANNIIGTGEGWITELSTEKLKELFKLDRSAVLED